MAELADRLVVSRYNVTRLVDRLGDEGLVAREPAPDDARGAFAVLTPAGRAMRRKMWPVYGAAIDELFTRHLSAAERKAMEAAFAKVLAPYRKG
jgi:DNA-binding MarR family transcriptional regulator